MLGPAAVCRVDADTVRRVRDGRDLLPLVLGCAATIVIGTAAYGATIGMWRDPLQACYAATKLVALFVALFGLTTASNAVFGGLLRARLSFRQVAACCLLGLAVTAALLGALAPVSWFLVRHAPPVEHHAASMRVAHQLLMAHIVVLAIAGVLGVRRVYGLLRELVDDPAVARRVLWAWLLIEGLVGAELSWVLRPFLGKPDLPIALFRPDAFDSSFFESVAGMTRTLLGPAGPWIAIGVVATAIVLVAVSLAARGAVAFRLHERGLTMQHVGSPHPFEVTWAEIRSVRRMGRHVEVARLDARALRLDVLVLPCGNESEATAAFEAIERARHGHDGPFRRPPLEPAVPGPAASP